jgi:hypothetical protein
MVEVISPCEDPASSLCAAFVMAAASAANGLDAAGFAPSLPARLLHVTGGRVSGGAAHHATVPLGSGIPSSAASLEASWFMTVLIRRHPNNSQARIPW